MIEELARDYSKFIKVDLQCELHGVQDTIDDMLTRLDEFENLVNMVKGENELCTDLSIPIILESKNNLDLLCKKVDCIEKLVNHVKSDMETLENQVDEAEQEIGQSSGKLKNMLKPLFSKKSLGNVSVQRQNPTPTYQAPTLFKTSSFFPPRTEDTVQEEQKYK